jgi:hypothetical protein
MALDFDKIPFEKAFHFLAKMLPGFTVIWIYDNANPGTLMWFQSIQTLGYATKLALLLLSSFLIGHIIATATAALLGAVGGIVGSTNRFCFRDRHPYEDDIAPWRNSEWRAAYRTRNGSVAPEDMKLVPKHVAESLFGNLPLPANVVDNHFAAQAEETYNSFLKMTAAYESVINDREWKRIYQQLHWDSILNKRMEFIEEITVGLDSNLALSSMLILAFALFLPKLRLWWLVALSAVCVGTSLIRFASKAYPFVDLWSSLRPQIDSLNSKK